MKRSDILLIIVVGIIVGALSLVVANFFFGGEKQYNLKAPEVQAIQSELPVADSTYFNDKALNPTKNISIGDSTNQEPFKKEQ